MSRDILDKFHNSFLLNFHVYIYSLCVYLFIQRETGAGRKCMYTPSPLPPGQPKDRTQVPSLGSNHLYSLSHLAGLDFYFLDMQNIFPFLLLGGTMCHQLSYSVPFLSVVKNRAIIKLVFVFSPVVNSWREG